MKTKDSSFASLEKVVQTKKLKKNKKKSKLEQKAKKKKKKKLRKKLSGRSRTSI